KTSCLNLLLDRLCNTPAALGPWPRPLGRGRVTVATWFRPCRCLVLFGIATWGSGLIARAPEPFPLSRASPFPLSLSSPLGVPAFLGCLPLIEAAVLKRLSLRVVFVPCGARRRRFYIREGPNGCVLRVEVGTLDLLALGMLPFPFVT
ncbi:hypothetical protein Taro_025930, partial [Colocasia esculenta]|nr:hypothetical protein [Colocasia esculenta]